MSSSLSWRIDSTKKSFTAAEFEVLKSLAAHPGWVYSRQQIIEHLWDGKFYGGGSHSGRPRSKYPKKVEADLKNPRYILTVRGMGYKFAEIA